MSSISLTADPIADTLLELDLLKADLRIGHVDLDELIWRQHLPAAILRAEAFTRRAIVQRSHRWVIDEFPYNWQQVLTLPRGKCASVTSIVVSQNGTPITYRGPSSGSPAGTAWQEDLTSDLGARLMPPRGGSWPWCDADVPAPIVITFVAGWTLGTLPADVRRGLVKIGRAHV